jgi:hypothetical protein
MMREKFPEIAFPAEDGFGFSISGGDPLNQPPIATFRQIIFLHNNQEECARKQYFPVLPRRTKSAPATRVETQPNGFSPLLKGGKKGIERWGRLWRAQ